MGADSVKLVSPKPIILSQNGRHLEVSGRETAPVARLSFPLLMSVGQAYLEIIINIITCKI